MAVVPTTETGGKLIPPPENFAGKANCPTLEAYQKMYQRSVEDPEGFWGEVADNFVWNKKWDKVREYTFEGNVSI
ncbi:MAG TPA: acetyl-coenzyme A synthetase N-terminal domain-containing protein, partial [Candidatus Anammoximicrobium sp.]|nr:acetyl-coenzyme A synthetase N-terminal domain-containing protein [Candidatus Anammoximicrobium sp.]